MKYQHKTPQRDANHAVKPNPTSKRLRCVVCGRPIKLVPNNDGPESLKAMLSF